MRPRNNLFTIVSVAAIAVCAACDNEPAAGKTRATVQEVGAADPALAKAPQPSAAGTRYAFSQDDSKIDFVGAKVTGKHDGSFKRFSGTIQMTDTAAGPTAGAVSVEIEIASLVTDTDKLTGHLKSAELLDAAQFPKARFTSTSLTALKETSYNVTGNIELHGVTKQISFPATIHATAENIEADAEFAINRKDFGITYPGKPDDLIKDDVLLKLTIRASRAKS